MVEVVGMEDLRVWNQVLEQLKQECGDQGAELWFGAVKFLSRENHRVLLEVPNLFCRKWIEDKFGKRLLEIIKFYFGPAAELAFQIREETEDEFSAGPLAQTPAPESARRPGGSAETVPWETRSIRSNLNPRYTFENFVIGPCNQFAHAASKAIAEAESVKYNPLFIYGGVGLGKTHLLNAIGNRILERRPALRVVSIQAESFLNDLISCIRTDKIVDFRKRFRKNCDVLLIDDIEILCGKERTQEEFFYTFNELFEAGKQIVMSSDRIPSELPELTERLSSRFESGMLVDIQPPEYETKIAIIKRKAAESKISIPEEVCEYLAKSVRSNIRKLEGCLIRICAFASINGQPVTLDLTKNLLSNLLVEGDKNLNPDKILKEVAKGFGIKVQDLRGEKRMRKFVVPRQVAMFICRKYLKQSFPEIGETFEGKNHATGKKDHSTVIHSCRKIDSLLITDQDLRKKIQNILTSIGIKEELD